MKAGFHSRNSVTKRIFAGLLAVWLSGVVFLLCCGMPKAQAEIESCPLAKIGHCAKSSGDENALRFEIFQNADSSFDCCGFLPQVFDKVRKAERNQEVSELPIKLEVPALSFNFINTQAAASFYCRPRPIDRSGTYLRNRVFRI